MIPIVQNRSSQPIRNRAVDPRATRWSSNAGLGWWNNRLGAFTAYSLITGSTDGPPATGITTYARGTVQGGGRQTIGFHLAENTETATPNPNTVPIQAGTRWTLALWYRVSVACTVSLRYRFGAADGTWAGAATVVNVAVQPSQWARVPATFTAPANAVSLAAQVVVAETLADGDSFDGTGLMLVPGSDPGVHLDGTTYNWQWTGAANASESVGYLDPVSFVRNRIGNPSLTTAGTGWSSNDGARFASARLTTGGVDGGPCFQTTRTATAVDTETRSTSVYVHGFSGTNQLRSLKVTPGETVMGSWSVKTDAANRSTFVGIYFRDIAGVQLGGIAGQTTAPLTPDKWTRVFSLPVVVPAGADSMIISGQVFSTDGTFPAAGEVVLFDQAFAGPPHTNYADGGTPGWRWTGASGTSPSVGLPYTLEWLTGTSPLATLSAPGEVALTTAQLSPLAARTSYAVIDRLKPNDTTGVRTIAHTARPLAGSLETGYLRTAPMGVGSGAYEFRVQGKGGAANARRDNSAGFIDYLTGNLLTNPTPAGSVTGTWVTNNGNVGAVTYVANAGDGQPAAQVIRSAGGVAAGEAATLYATNPGGLAAIKTTPGTAIQAAVLAKAGAANRALRIYVTFRDAAGTSVATDASTAHWTPLTAGNWIRCYSPVLVAPPTADSVIFVLRIQSWDGTIPGATPIPEGEVSQFRIGYLGPPLALPAPGRMIISLGQNEGLTSHDISVNGNPVQAVTASDIAGEGYGAPGIKLEPADAYESPVFMMQFAGLHDLETRRRVEAWLARRYGGPISPGY